METLLEAAVAAIAVAAIAVAAIAVEEERRAAIRTHGVL